MCVRVYKKFLCVGGTVMESHLEWVSRILIFLMKMSPARNSARNSLHILGPLCGHMCVCVSSLVFLPQPQGHLLILQDAT